jgi:hypothetical protein
MAHAQGAGLFVPLPRPYALEGSGVWIIGGICAGLSLNRGGRGYLWPCNDYRFALFPIIAPPEGVVMGSLACVPVCYEGVLYPL